MRKFLQGLTRSSKIHLQEHILNDLTISPCTACDACRGKTETYCIIDDDMQKLYQEFIDAELVVLASPIYWWSISAQLKLFIDRLYGLNSEKNPQFFKGKKLVLILTYYDEDPNSGAELALEMFKEISNYTEMNLAGVLRYSSGKQHVKDCPEILENAFLLGSQLGES